MNYDINTTEGTNMAFVLEVVFDAAFNFDKVQSDYEQGNPLEMDYIKNKPNLEAYVKYIGATQNVDLGEHSIETTSVIYKEEAPNVKVPLQRYYDAESNTTKFVRPDGGETNDNQEIGGEFTNVDSITLLEKTLVSAVPLAGNRKGMARLDISSKASVENFLGMVTIPSISVNGKGLVTFTGEVDADTSGLLENAQIYAGVTPGTWSLAPPAKGYYTVIVGTVVVSAHNGKVFLKSRVLPKLNDLSDVTNNASEGQPLTKKADDTWASSDTIKIEKIVPPSGELDIEGNQEVTGAQKAKDFSGETLGLSGKATVNEIESTTGFKKTNATDNDLLTGAGGKISITTLKSGVYQLFNPTNNTQTVLEVNAAGEVLVHGPIIQTGTGHQVDFEKVTTKEQQIELRHGATTGMPIGDLAGFIIKLYDGVNDGMIVIDNNGVLRIGDVGDLQPVLTREETPIDMSPMVFNESTNRAETVPVTEVKTSLADADAVLIKDSVDNNKPKWWTFANIKANLKTYFDSLFLRLADVPQTVAGIITFSKSPIVPNPTTSGQALNKGTADTNYVPKDGDVTINNVKTFTSSPIVPNPTTSGQALNKGTADGAYVALTGAQNIAGVKTFTDKPIVPTPTGSTEAANKGYVDSAVVGAMPAASAALLPQLAYKTRVDTDSGLIKDLEKLTKLYIDVLELNKTAEVLFDGRSGYKLTTGKLSKLYNMAKAVDYTSGAGAEFYIGGFVAPNEGFKIKGLTGETGTKAVTGTAKSYLATESWTAGIMLMFNKLSATTQRIYLSAADYLLISSTAVSWVNAGGTVLTCTHSLKVGINNYIEFQYNNGAGLIKVNGVAITTTATAQAVSVDRIQLNQTTYNFDGAISHFILLTGRISESASQQYYTFIRGLIPEIEGIAIGNQYWQTSNYEGVVAGDGSVIQEIQDSNNTHIIPEALNLLDGWNAINGAVINDANTFTSGASLTGVSRSVSTTLKIGESVKITLNLTTTATDVVVGDSYGAAGSFVRFTPVDGVINETKYLKWTGSGVSNLTLYIRLQEAGSTADITTFTVEKVGWSQSTALYDAVYAQTSGTAAVKELAALKAAAMWCYYNNDVNNGAIYGKLYNWYAVKLISLYPPQGWRVPSGADFTQLSNYLGGTSVAGGKMKKEGLAYWASPNTGATNESGMSLIPNGFRSIAGVFTSQTTRSVIWGVNIAPVLVAPGMIAFASDATISLASNDNKLQGFSLRLLRNSPVGQNERTITSTTIVSDIASTANSTQIPFGYSVASIRLKTTANLTNIKVELWNNYSNGLSPALVATLITGKTANNTTMVFPVLADCPSLLQDGTLRITATGANTFETIVEYNLQKNTF